MEFNCKVDIEYLGTESITGTNTIELSEKVNAFIEWEKDKGNDTLDPVYYAFVGVVRKTT